MARCVSIRNSVYRYRYGISLFPRPKIQKNAVMRKQSGPCAPRYLLMITKRQSLSVHLLTWGTDVLTMLIRPLVY